MADELIQAMTELYQTMSYMCDNQLTVKLAPGGGHVLPPRLAANLQTRKSAAAIEFMRRIPYIDPKHHIVPNSESINYLKADDNIHWEGSYAWDPLKWRNHISLDTDVLDEEAVGRDEVPVTTYDDEVGSILVVNCVTYTARLWDYDDTHGCCKCTVHTNNNDDPGPPMCTHAVSGVPEQRPAIEFFREWRQKYLDLTWMLKPGDHEVIWGDADEDWFMITQWIFREHGWLNDYRSEECQKALEFAPHPLDDLDDYSDTDEEDEEIDEEEERRKQRNGLLTQRALKVWRKQVEKRKAEDNEARARDQEYLAAMALEEKIT